MEIDFEIDPTNAAEAIARYKCLGMSRFSSKGCSHVERAEDFTIYCYPDESKVLVARKLKDKVPSNGFVYEVSELKAGEGIRRMAIQWYGTGYTVRRPNKVVLKERLHFGGKVVPAGTEIKAFETENFGVIIWKDKGRSYIARE